MNLLQSIKKYVLLLIASSCTQNNPKKLPAITNYEIATLENNFDVVGCGQFAFVYGFIFKIQKNDSLIIGFIRCPDGLDSGFLKEDSNCQRI